MFTIAMSQQLVLFHGYGELTFENPLANWHMCRKEEDMSSNFSFNQVAQLVKKLETIGWDASLVTKLGQASLEKWQAIASILGETSQNTTHLRHLLSLTLAPTSGGVTLAEAKAVFPGLLDSDFENWGTNQPGVDTAATKVDVFEMEKDGNYRTLFGSLQRDPRSFCLSQGQIVRFCQDHREHLRQDGFATFFPFAVKRQGSKEYDLFVAHVSVGVGELRAYVNRFAVDDVWDADYRRRLVVQQQTV